MTELSSHDPESAKALEEALRDRDDNFTSLGFADPDQFGIRYATEPDKSEDNGTRSRPIKHRRRGFTGRVHDADHELDRDMIDMDPVPPEERVAAADHEELQKALATLSLKRLQGKANAEDVSLPALQAAEAHRQLRERGA